MHVESVCEYCWLEAFRSNPSLVHYLRLRFCGDNWENNKRQAAKICQGLYKTDNELYFMLLFWNKEFDTVMTQGMSVRESLGWSFTFMKEGITSFLLLLYQGTDLPAGLSCLLNYIQQKNFIKEPDIPAQRTVLSYCGKSSANGNRR